MTEGPLRPPDPSGALCTACGACCNGTLFDEVPLERAEIALGPRLRLPIVAAGDDACMALPCPRLEVATCTVYPDRPSGCRSYKCGLLDELELGEVAEAEAHVRVTALRDAARRVRELLPVDPGAPIMRLFERFAEEQGGRRSAHFEARHQELILRMRELATSTRAVTRGVTGKGA